MEKMFVAVTVLLLIATACATPQAPILVSECATLSVPFATYKLANNVVVNNSVDKFVCFDITSNGITLDGNGYGISTLSQTYTDAIGVQYEGANVTVTNLQISYLKTGILAKGKYGTVTRNIITETVNGIDVSATHNDVSYNTIRGSSAAGLSSGIYVYFPSVSPTAAHVTITNNVISDIQAEDFALGISVYYATAVNIAYNRIFNLRGEFSKEISIIGGEAEIKGNVFGAVPIEAPSFSSAILLSCAAVLVSALWFVAMQKEKEKVKERVKEENEKAEKKVKEEKETEARKKSEEKARIEKEKAKEEEE